MFDHPSPAPDRLQPLQQSAIYQDALIRLGARVRRFPMPSGAALVVERALPLTGRVALLSRPDLGDNPCARDLTGLRRALGASALIVNAETGTDAAALGRAGFVRLAAGQPVAVLSLDGTPEDWLRHMGGKWRNRLRHGQRQGLTVDRRPYPPDPLHWLFHRDAETQKAQGYRGLPPRLVTAMTAADPGALHLFTARREGRAVAAILFAQYGHDASYLIGWADAQGRAASAHPVLILAAMRELDARGVARIDLGLCCHRTSPGLARFKRGSGAVVRRLGGTWADAGATAPLHAVLRRWRRGLPATPVRPSP